MIAGRPIYTELIDDLSALLSQPRKDYGSHFDSLRPSLQKLFLEERRSDSLGPSWLRLSLEERTDCFDELEQIEYQVRELITPMSQACLGDGTTLRDIDSRHDVSSETHELAINCRSYYMARMDDSEPTNTSDTTPNLQGLESESEISPVAGVMQKCKECLLKHLFQLLQSPNSALTIADQEEPNICLQKNQAKIYLLYLLSLFEDVRLVHYCGNRSEIGELRGILAQHRSEQRVQVHDKHSWIRTPFEMSSLVRRSCQ